MKSAIRSPNLSNLAICPLLVNKTAIAATGLALALDTAATALQLWQSPGKLFREARRASPSAKITERASDGAGLPSRASFGRRPENRFGKPNGPAPSAKITEASASDAPLRGCRPRKFSREARRARPPASKRERAFGQPDRPDPSPNLR